MARELQQLKNRLILVQCRQHKDEGFRLLIESYEKPIFYYVRRFVDREEDAWDVLQEVWIKALRSIAGVQSADTLNAWLYRVAHNTIVDHQRRNHRWDPLPEDDEPGAIADEAAMQESLNLASAADVHWGLEKLPPAEREVLTLFFLEEFSIHEIAQISGVPDGTVKSRLHRARRNLRVILEKESRT